MSSSQEARQPKKRGILLATSGMMLALVVSLGLRLLGLTPFNTRDWIFSAALLLAVESFLWLIPHLGCDEVLRWDPHYLRLPMIVASFVLALFTYIDPAARVLILMLWFVALMFLVGKAGFADVAALSTLNATGYLVALAARRARGWSISLPFEAATAACFLITCLYVGFVFERLRREHMDRRALRQKLADLAVTDALTTLPNRRHFEETLRTELARVQRYGGECSVVMIDVDRFKNYNDRLGHLAGDELLRELASLIRRSLRRGDGAARYGGEEFALVMTNTGKAEGLEVLERLRTLVASYPFDGCDCQPQGIVTISAGIATCPQDGSEYEELIRKADEALYAAKAGGRNRVEAP